MPLQVKKYNTGGICECVLRGQQMIIKCPNCPDKKEIKDGTDKVVYEICLKCLKDQHGEGDK